MRMEAWRYLNYTSSFPFPTTLVFSLGLSPASRVPRRAIRETGNLGLICWGSYTLILLPFSIPVSCCRLGFHEPVWCLCNVHHHCSVMLWISLVSSWEHLPGLILLHASSNCLFYTFLVLPHSQLPAPWLIFFFFFFFGWKAVGRWVTGTVIMSFLWCSQELQIPGLDSLYFCLRWVIIFR